MADSKDTSSSRSFLSEIRNQISEMDAHILALENSLAAARREREDLQSRLDDYKYPVLTLPAEITSEIFIAYLPVYPECSPMTGLFSPAVLGQVCRDWRAIAFDKPSLWRAIKLHIPGRNQYSTDAQLIVLKTWLSRSRSCRLSLSLEQDRLLRVSKLSYFTDTLISHAARWEHVEITGFNNLDWIAGPFPLLCRLTLVPSSRVGKARKKLTLFHDAPHLTSVVLGELFELSDVVLPWSQLTSITAESLALEDAANILRKATVLVNFHCSLREVDDVPRAVRRLVHLESLIIFSVEDFFRDSQQLLLDALTTPALRHLSISERELAFDPISTITSFLSRSHCSLDSLHVTHSRRDQAEYRAAFPHIKVIQVLDDDSDDDLDEDEEASSDDGDD